MQCVHPARPDGCRGASSPRPVCRPRPPACAVAVRWRAASVRSSTCSAASLRSAWSERYESRDRLCAADGDAEPVPETTDQLTTTTTGGPAVAALTDWSPLGQQAIRGWARSTNLPPPDFSARNPGSPVTEASTNGPIPLRTVATDGVSQRAGQPERTTLCAECAREEDRSRREGDGMTATSAFRGFDRLRLPGAIGAIVALAVGLLVPASHGAGADWSAPTQPTRDERAAGGMFEAAGDVAPLDSFPSDDPVGGPTESSSRTSVRRVR